MTTADAVSPHVSPVLTGKEASTPSSGESGAGKKGHALSTGQALPATSDELAAMPWQSWQL